MSRSLVRLHASKHASCRLPLQPASSAVDHSRRNQRKPKKMGQLELAIVLYVTPYSTPRTGKKGRSRMDQRGAGVVRTGRGAWVVWVGAWVGAWAKSRFRPVQELPSPSRLTTTTNTSTHGRDDPLILQPTSRRGNGPSCLPLRESPTASHQETATWMHTQPYEYFLGLI